MANQWVRITAGRFAGQVCPIRKAPPELRHAGARVGGPKANPAVDERNAPDVPKYLVLHPEVLGLRPGYPCWVRAHECRLLPEGRCRDLDLQHDLREEASGRRMY